MTPKINSLAPCSVLTSAAKEQGFNRDPPMPKMKSKAKCNITQIARRWAVSRTRVQQLMAEGCPTNSFQAADLWRKARGQKRPPTNTKICKFADEPRGKGRPPKPKTPSRTGDSLQDALNNAIAVADGAFEDYEYARVNKLASRSIRLSEHNKALDSRLKTEKAYREELERRETLVNKHEITDLCRRSIDAVLRRLKKLPDEQGPQCNPENPMVARGILQAEVNAIIAVGQKVIINDLKSPRP